jgi:hypothetical protein
LFNEKSPARVYSGWLEKTTGPVSLTGLLTLKKPWPEIARFSGLSVWVMVPSTVLM